MMQAAILAGGLATRLRPITFEIPKSMVPIEGRPFLAHQLELLAKHGVRDVVLCVGHLAEQIKDYFGDGSAFGVKLSYSDEGGRALGTAGALKLAQGLLADRFFVLFGDSYLLLDYAAIWRHFVQRDRLALMVVYRNDNRHDTSDVLVEDGFVTLYDKTNPMPGMVFINEGLSVLRREALDLIEPDQPIPLQAFFQKLVERRELLALETAQRFYEIGSFAGLEALTTLLRSKLTAAHQTLLQYGGAMSYATQYLTEAVAIIDRIDVSAIEKMGSLLADLRERRGRIFFLGVGGGAANASHAVNDFRKIAGIEAYTPTDNVSELTARINDDGWDSAYRNWLKGSRLGPEDMVFVFSVGGGDVERNVSTNLVRALDYAREVGAVICGVLGRDGGYTARVADVCVVVPTINPETVTPHTESFQAFVWHLLVSDPVLRASQMKWESVS